jgi:membrane-associated phospholipid phosphatase
MPIGRADRERNAEPPAPTAGAAARRLGSLLPGTLGLIVFLVATAVLMARHGPFMILRDWLWIWIVAGLLAISLGSPLRAARRIVVDWLPFIAVIVAYDLLRGLSDGVVSTPHYAQQVDAERFLFFGHLPTLWLQQRLWHPPAFHIYDYVCWSVYNTHFVVTLLVAAGLWLVDRDRFRRFRVLVAALAFTGMATFFFYPSLPPWLASRDRRIPQISRLVDDVWGHVGISGGSGLFENGSRWANEFAAIPSLHAAFPMLVLLFFATTRKPVMTALLAVYVTVMAFALVYTGEHYAVDVFAGWIYAGAVWWTIPRLGRRLRKRRRRAPQVGAPLELPAGRPLDRPLAPLPGSTQAAEARGRRDMA